MSVADNKALVLRFIDEGINQMQWATFDELVAETVDFDAPPGLPKSREGWKLNRQLMAQGFPDAHWAVTEAHDAGDHVVVRVNFRATHRGDFFGMPPTGREVDISGIAILQVAGGQIVRQLMQNDDLKMLIQLGVVTLPGQN